MQANWWRRSYRARDYTVAHTILLVDREQCPFTRDPLLKPHGHCYANFDRKSIPTQGVQEHHPELVAILVFRAQKRECVISGLLALRGVMLQDTGERSRDRFNVQIHKNK
jgi:hypothetical protein